jgi:hypothetical protein
MNNPNVLIYWLVVCTFAISSPLTYAGDNDRPANISVIVVETIETFRISEPIPRGVLESRGLGVRYKGEWFDYNYIARVAGAWPIQKGSLRMLAAYMGYLRDPAPHVRYAVGLRLTTGFNIKIMPERLLILADENRFGTAEFNECYSELIEQISLVFEIIPDKIPE